VYYVQKKYRKKNVSDSEKLLRIAYNDFTQTNESKKW
jgi:hypothetical protein